MTTIAHVALRVSDIDRSTRFYTEALDGRVVMDLPLDSEFVESIFDAPAGTTADNRYIAFDGSAIEIYQFFPGRPIPVTKMTSAGLTHFCLGVENVLESVARVEAAGGRARFPVRPFGKGRHFVYVEDPDGHVVELVDASLEECIEWTAAGELPDVNRAAG